jgi:hypothetical protein
MRAKTGLNEPAHAKKNHEYFPVAKFAVFSCALYQEKKIHKEKMSKAQASIRYEPRASWQSMVDRSEVCLSADKKNALSLAIILCAGRRGLRNESSAWLLMYSLTDS